VRVAVVEAETLSGRRKEESGTIWNLGECGLIWVKSRFSESRLGGKHQREDGLGEEREWLVERVGFSDSL